MFKSLAFILKLISIQMKPGNYDTAFLAIFIRHFNKTSLDKTMIVWSMSPTGKRYLKGDSIITNVPKNEIYELIVIDDNSQDNTYNLVKEYSKSVLGIPLSEHVPDLTAKDDIIIIKDYLKKQYPNTLKW